MGKADQRNGFLVVIDSTYCIRRGVSLLFSSTRSHSLRSPSFSVRQTILVLFNVVTLNNESAARVRVRICTSVVR